MKEMNKNIILMNTCCDLENNNFENSLKIDLFQEIENNLNKDFSLISPITDNEDDYKWSAFI